MESEVPCVRPRRLHIPLQRLRRDRRVVCRQRGRRALRGVLGEGWEAMKAPDFVVIGTPDAEGRMGDGIRGKLLAHLRKYAGQALEIRIRPYKAKRSLAANARYWALLTLGARSIGYDDVEELHEAVAWKLLRLPDDERTGTPRRHRTPNLNTTEFKDYCDAVERLLIEYGADLTGWEDEAERIQRAA